MTSEYLFIDEGKKSCLLRKRVKGHRLNQELKVQVTNGKACYDISLARICHRKRHYSWGSPAQTTDWEPNYKTA